MEWHVRGIDGDYTGVPAHFALLALLTLLTVAVGCIVRLMAKRGEGDR